MNNDALLNNSIRSSRILASILTLGFILSLALASPAAHAQAYTEQNFYTFQGGTTDGNNPLGGLVDVRVNGVDTLYGTTQSGGTNNSGTIFSIDPSTKTKKTLYNFGANSSDANDPCASMIYVNGLLYGTTRFGGTDNYGAIFTFDPATQIEHILASFNGTDGAGSVSGLNYANGTLYGTTEFGGAQSTGTVFSINPSSPIITVLYSFSGTDKNGFNADGGYPEAAVLDVNGILYGTTPGGGTHGYGTVFAVDPSAKTETTLHDFQGNPDGTTSEAGLVLFNGTLYGTTFYGGDFEGTIFSVKPDGTGYQVVYEFQANGNADGINPQASLIAVNGLLYGTTFQGTNTSTGTVYSFDPATKTETVIYNFSSAVSTDGRELENTLVDVSVNGIDTLYGTTTFGGANNAGTLFALTPVIVPPTAHNDTYAPKYQTAYVVSAAKGVLGNDNSGGSTTLTATLVSNVTHGTLTLNSDGSFTYTPSTGFVGTDSFTYQAGNAAGKSNTATVTLNVFAAVPLARNDTYAPKYATLYAVKAPGVLGNDTNYDTGAMTAALVTNPSHGTLTLNADGSFTYTPAAGFVGADSFTYYASNPIGNSSTATVTLNVYAAAPIAKNDAYSPKFQTAYAVKAPGVLGNDYTGGSTTTAVLVTNPSHGSLTFNADGSFTYTPSTGYLGPDSFTYKDTNSVGTSGAATVNLTVQTSTPIAHSDSATFKHNTTLTVAAPGVLANDYTGGSTPLTATIVTQPNHGTVTLNSNGSYVYTPTAGYIGTDSFTYRVSNPVGTGTTAPVTLNVQ